MTLQGSLAVHANKAQWSETAFRSFLQQTDRTGEVDLPLLGVGLYEGVRERKNNDGRQAASEDLSGYKIVQEGDVVMNRLGKPHGSVGVSPMRGITSPAYWVMEIDRHQAHPPFVHHLLRSKHMVREYERLGKYMPPNQFDISWDAFRSIEVPLPPIDQQRRIADFLDAETARIDHLRHLQISVLKQLDQRDRAVRDSLADSLASQVGALPLRRYSDKIEQGASPSCENYPREADGWGVIKLSAVKGGRFFSEENKQLPDDIEPARQYELRDGDLLVTRANTPELVGDVAVVEGAVRRLLLPDLIYRVGLGRGIRADFVAQILLSTRVRTLIQATARGSSQSMVKLRGEDVREWPIPRADILQQTAFVSAVREQLESTAKLRAAIDQQLTLLAERRQALITAAVTGGISV